MGQFQLLSGNGMNKKRAIKALHQQSYNPLPGNNIIKPARLVKTQIPTKKAAGVLSPRPLFPLAMPAM
jgi:hypothetical protein